MNPYVKWYLIGVAIAILINLLIMLTSDRVRVSNVIGYLLNAALSWGCIATFLCQSLIALLNRLHWNKIIWESERAKEQRQEEQKKTAQKVRSIH